MIISVFRRKAGGDGLLLDGTTAIGHTELYADDTGSPLATIALDHGQDTNVYTPRGTGIRLTEKDGDLVISDVYGDEIVTISEKRMLAEQEEETT